MSMRTETLFKMLTKMENLHERRVVVRLDGVEYLVSHVEHKDDEMKDVIVICPDDGD